MSISAGESKAATSGKWRLSAIALLTVVSAMVGLVLPNGPAWAQLAPDGLPFGNWRQHCSNGRLNGSQLIAFCRMYNGSAFNARADIAVCKDASALPNRIVVAYWPGDGRFYCGAGNGFVLPGGGWRDFCTSATKEGAKLRAWCVKSNDRLAETVVNLIQCPFNDVEYRNDQLVCGGPWTGNTFGVNAAEWMPKGRWRESCEYKGMQESVFFAFCKDQAGGLHYTSIDTNTCYKRGVANNNGKLVCGPPLQFQRGG